MAKVNFEINMKPSALMRVMQGHQDPSETDKPRVIGTVKILGYKVVFYANGERVVEGLDLDLDDQHNSEVLRFAHASLLTGQPEGDKSCCWVDASQDPCEVWIYGQRIETFVQQAKSTLQYEIIVDGNPVQELRGLNNGLNV